MRRPVLILTLLLALAAPLVPATAAAAAPAVQWAPCAENAEVECGTLTVPIDWNNPGAGTFELALARRRASDPAARVGSLVINPGGPGGSGVDAVLNDWLGFTPEITSRFDVVGFDPRGVARSHPVTCSLELAQQAPDPLSLKSQADWDAMLAYNKRYRDDCRRRTGPLFDHVHTGYVIRDLDALRAALGDDKLTYYGVSYGTLIGQLYAERYPRRIRALALDSNMDHSLGTQAFLDTESWTSQDSFNEFVAWCDRTTSCALHGRDVRAVWHDLLARAERGEVSFPGQPEVKLRKLDLIGLAFSAFYGPAWSRLAELLAAMDSGAEVPASPLLAPPAARAAGDTAEDTAGDTAEDTVNDAGFVFCQDYALPVRDYRDWARLLRRSAAIAPDMLVSAAAHPLALACQGTATPNPQHRLKVDGSPTLLLGNAVHDPATAYPWAVNAALQIGREGRLLTYEGWGHGIYGRGDCPTGAFDRYLVSGALPAPGARCPAVPPADMAAKQAPRPYPGPLPGRPGWASLLR
ncbi:alpha/beta hydrolase [Actinomadura sp. ATCC 31491]|uniref:Alpha/beta hydrolase n=1 Tax=Actinomadura luzonensis TaxID=2805427 RepID=A0ABT0FRS9_9ACTN|nr:alpha/beta fold hydrolase [Actinomadura luzonensis]MCK2215017.1 alpha/beta hydrolase [Actinomadura luzonensis]